MIRAIDNPFAVHRVMRLRFRPQGTSWEQLMARLASLNYRAAIVGPKGSGKTTLLEDIAVRLEAQNFACVIARAEFDDSWKKRTFRTREVLLLDSAEKLTRWDWWNLQHRTRDAAGLIVTTHQPSRLPTLIETSTSPALLAELLMELSQSREKHAVENLFERHDGNLREAIRELYDERAA